ncbi:MAG TPA: ABC transporter ATP-binding protein [Iamia sp.]|nr:ABC transporter ATP-binding protein [Iamia sp.]
MGTAIEVRGLRKAYGAHEAVRGVDLTVEAGEVLALLGPNGAGKTTTVEILEGLRDRTGGEVRVLGQDPATADRGWRARIGVVLQETGVEPYLTVGEVVDLHRGWYPAPRPTAEVLDLVGLTGSRGVRAHTLSGGQRRRLDVAIALAGGPEVLFLDEPTTGFDPAARRDAWAMVRGLQAAGTTVLLTTHDMDEAVHLADRAAVLVAGRIVASGPPSALGGDTRTRIACRLPPGAAGLPPELAAGIVASGDDGELVLRTDDPTATLHALTGWALAAGVVLADLVVRPPSLEEVYLDLIRDGAG